MMESVKHSPAIVIAAYNRPECLRRLLRSVNAADYTSEDITLVISIDGPPDEEVTKIAESFQWPHGQLRIIKHMENLGLVNHMFSCVDLSKEYGSVILLEDDLFVSPAFYDYAVQAITSYQTNEAIAGLSLYSYQISENGFQPFVPVDDGSDVYFMQVPSSWGVAFSDRQWSDFRKFLQVELEGFSQNRLPGYVQLWPNSSWKKLFFSYLIATNKYLVYPRSSLCTNFGDTGTHMLSDGLFQVSLREKTKKYQFAAFEDSPALYDAWFELKPEGLNRLIPDFREYTYEIDLAGTKTPEQFAADYFLTAKQGENATRTYGLEMIPPIANVLHNVPGNNLRFIRKENIRGDVSKSATVYGPWQWQRLSGAEGVLTLSVLISCERGQNGLEDTITSISNQGETVKEIIVTGKMETTWTNPTLPVRQVRSDGKDAVFNAMQIASGDIYCWIAPGVCLNYGVIGDVKSIFHDFPGMQCVLGLAAAMDGKFIRNVPRQRWTAEMIHRCPDAEIEKSFLPGCLFFRREVFRKIMGEVRNCTLTGLIRKIAETEKIFTLAHVTAVCKNGSYRSQQTRVPAASGIKLLQRITRPAFLRDITFLRFFHYEMNQFPDVIRKDEKYGTWYLSRY
ncbi:MAG TPA: glycosyltransferase [Chitinophagaceae bacterium]